MSCLRSVNTRALSKCSFCVGVQQQHCSRRKCTFGEEPQAVCGGALLAQVVPRLQRGGQDDRGQHQKSTWPQRLQVQIHTLRIHLYNPDFYRGCYRTIINVFAGLHMHYI